MRRQACGLVVERCKEWNADFVEGRLENCRFRTAIAHYPHAFLTAVDDGGDGA